MPAPPPTPPAQHGWLRRLWPAARQHRRDLVAALALAVFGQGLLGLLPLVQQVIVDDAVLADRQPLGPLLAVLLAVGVVGFGAQYQRRHLTARFSLDVQHDLRVAVHRQVNRLDIARHDQLSSGDVMSRATADLTLVQMFLNQVPLVVGHGTLLVVAIAVMATLSPLLSVIVALFVPVFLVLAVRFRDRMFPASWADQALAGDVARVVEEAVTGVRVVKAFGQEERELDTLVDRAGRLFGSRLRSARLSARYSATLQVLPSLAQAGVLALGGWLAIEGRVTLGVFVAFSSYLVQLVTPVRLLSGMLATSQQARAGAERVLELLELEPLVTDLPGARPLLRPRGAIELDRVTFAYSGADGRPGAPVLRDVSLVIEPGERVAVIGASGSGKSTLAHLIARFHDPTTGVVRIDGTDVRHHTLASVRRAVGIVFEESFLFTGSIGDNISFGRPDATPAEVEAAARLARAHGFIAGLPDGYATAVGERGLSLSGGQRQRIALARAALANSRILVLDDATSAIDARTEEAILTGLEDAMADRTTVLVAHRQSTLRLADRVIVLDEGRVVADGSPAVVAASCPLYGRLLAGPRTDAPGDDDATPVAPTVAPSTPAVDSGPVPWRAGLAAATPELLARVAALPPVRDEPDVDVAAVAAPDSSYSLRTLVRPFRWALALGLALVAVDALTTLAGPLVIRRGIDSGVVPASGGVVAACTMAYLLVQGVSWVNARAMQLQTARTAERMLFALRVRIFSHLQRLSLEFYDREMGGRIMTRMTSDVEACAQLLQQGLLTAVVGLTSCVGVLVVLVVLDAHLAVAVAAVIPVLVVATVVYRRASGRAYLIARERLSVVNGAMQEDLAGVRVTQALDRQARSEADFARLSRGYRDARLRAMQVLSFYFPVPLFLAAVAKALTLAVAAPRVADGSLSAGVLVAFLLYVDQLFTPIQQLSMVFDQWVQARVGLGRIDELLRTPTATPASAAPVPVAALAGEVRFEGVRFGYAGAGTEALRGVDLVVRPGETVAFVGTTGAGKSTLVKLVARFYDPTAGRVLVDGVPVGDLDLAGYRRRLGYVPQEPFLFSGTVRSNIAYGRPGATDAEVERAARAVGAHALVASLPDGYLTAVVEGGRAMSAGERQLLCLARAELVDPAILILDEATSNIDLATEAEVQRAMRRLARRRTTLLVAHRLQTARTADRIAVVEDGVVVEEGTHDELVGAAGRYAGLWSTFTAAEAEAEVQAESRPERALSTAG